MSKEKKSKVIIGFDFDKVFVNYPPLIPDWFIDWLYKKKSKSLRYRFPNSFEQKIRIFSHYPIFRHPLWNNIQVLRSLKNSRLYEMYLVSGRLGFLDKRTEAWIKKFSFNTYFNHMYFNFENKQSHIFKDMMIKKLNISHFIDDDLDLLLFLAKNNPKVTFFWMNSNKFSKRFIPFENIHKITSLAELPKL